MRDAQLRSLRFSRLPQAVRGEAQVGAYGLGPVALLLLEDLEMAKRLKGGRWAEALQAPQRPQAEGLSVELGFELRSWKHGAMRDTCLVRAGSEEATAARKASQVGWFGYVRCIEMCICIY